MTREAIEEVKAECRRWWGRLAWGREAMRRNMETFRRCGKMTAEIEADNAKAEVERATQTRLAAAARVGIAALQARAEESSSLRRLGRLCARWREEANEMDAIAWDEPFDDTTLALECYERARTLRDCANALEREWAGTEPTTRRNIPPPDCSEDRSGRLASTARLVENSDLHFARHSELED